MSCSIYYSSSASRTSRLTMESTDSEFQEDFDEFFSNEAIFVGSVGNTFKSFVAWPPFDIGHDVLDN